MILHTDEDMRRLGARPLLDVSTVHPGDILIRRDCYMSAELHIKAHLVLSEVKSRSTPEYSATYHAVRTVRLNNKGVELSNGLLFTDKMLKSDLPWVSSSRIWHLPRGER